MKTKWYIALNPSKILLVSFTYWLLLTTLVFLLAKSARATGTIYIRSDGRIDPITAQFQRSGNTYTFTENIYDSIVVQKDNIVIDGAGNSLVGSGSGNGIYMLDRENVTIKNLHINHFGIGIHINDDYTGNSSNNIMIGNHITTNNIGVYFWGGVSNSTIIGNNITKNNEDGIFLFGTSNIISGNNITKNVRNGINLNWHSNEILGNNITNNGNGIYMGGNQPFSGASNNVIFYNNFVNNTQQIDDIHWHDPFTTPSINYWDNGSLGNYWSDYRVRYPNASELDNTGIWDTPYLIDEENQDNYPLISESPEITLISLYYPDSILIDGDNKTFTAKLLLRNDGAAEANKVRVEFQSDNANLRMISSEEKNILPSQESNLSAILRAFNTGEEYVSNCTFNVIYETASGKKRSFETPNIELTVTPQEKPDHTDIPIELVAGIMIVTLIGALAVVYLIRRRKAE